MKLEGGPGSEPVKDTSHRTNDNAADSEEFMVRSAKLYNELYDSSGTWTPLAVAVPTEI